MSSFSSFGRLRQITAVVARHGLGHYLEGRRSKRDGSRGDASELAGAAARFRALIEELGPTFIKFGQVLSTRADVLPAGFAEALQGLQDDCPALAPEVAVAAVEEGLGRPLAEVFAEFDRAPLASASVAQVHRAVLHGGVEVAVKVRRPGIRAQLLADLELMRVLARLAESIVEETGALAPQGIVDELERAFLAELDFEREARNIRRFRENLEGKERVYTVPKLYEEFCTSSVLVMELIRGARLRELTDDRDKRKIAANIVSASFEQLFVDGLFHADPHPGNAFILPDDRVALIDFGLVGELSYAMRETLMVLVVGVATRDADSVARLLYRVGMPDRQISLLALRDACASLFHAHLSSRKAVAGIESARLMSELLQLASRFYLRLPSEYALVARAGATVEGIIRDLDPKLEVLETARPYLVRLVEEQFAFGGLGEGAMKNLVRLRTYLRDLPLSMAQVLMDLETGKLQIHVASRELEVVGKNINALGLATFTGLIASGLVTGSMFILARYRLEVWGWPIVPIVGLYVASILFGVALGWYFLSPRARKLSLARFWRRRRRGQDEP